MRSVSQFAVSAAALVASAHAQFNPLSKNNVVAYWGQGPNQARLLNTCQNPSVDIIVIGFVNVFPDQGPANYPGTNFGNQCYDYYTVNGVQTKLLKTCLTIPDDIVTCQQQYGKKILLSIGGGYPTDYYINNKNTTKSAQYFAQFLWSAFGPVSASKPSIPRPWGNASVDGFDFDIESVIAKPPFSNYQSNGYVEMINYLKYTLYPQDTSKAYYISGAPQCIVPDVHLSTAIANTWFDFVFIQFYNTPQCSARTGISHMQGKTSNDITFDQWCGSTVKNPNIKMFLGLPGNSSAVPAANKNDYLTVPEVYNLTNRFYNAKKKFGGIMIYDATYGGPGNVICKTQYLSWMKTVLTSVAAGKPLPTNPTTCKAVATGKKVRRSVRESAGEWAM